MLVRRDGQMPLQENFCVENLVYIILHMRKMLKNEIGEDVCQDEGNSKYQYYKIASLKAIKPVGDIRNTQSLDLNT